MLPSLCRWSSATATVARNRPFSSQISPDQGIECMSSSDRPNGAHRDPFPTRNATAQPGRSWPRRRKAFLPLARLYCMKGMPRASSTVAVTEGGIAARIVMVRQREEGSELNSRSYLGQCDAIQRNDRRRDNHKHRIQSGRSRRVEDSSFKPAVPSRLFSCDRAF